MTSQTAYTSWSYLPLADGGFTLVSNATLDRLDGIRWRAHVTNPGTPNARVYVHGRRSGRIVAMHRLLMDEPEGLVVDHANGNGLDNRIENLRVCTAGQNTSNRSHGRAETSSRFKGVTWHKQLEKWQAHIHAHGQYYYLGVFEDERAAAAAYDAAAREHFGEFAALNLLAVTS